MKDVLNTYFERLANSNRMSHAFLICNTCLDNLKEDLSDILSDYFFDYKVDIFNNSDIFIIRPKNGLIVKEDIIFLQSEFKNKSQFNKNRVYIIDQAEKMNDYAANSLLKFLEEPESDVYAFLITSNINKVMSTIKSRCQIIILNDENIFNLEKIDSEIVDKIIEFISLFENEKLSSLAFINNYIDKKDDKENIKLYLTIIKYFYRDVLNYMIYEKINAFIKYDSYIKQISKLNNVKNIIDKLILLNKYENMVEYNVNLNLFLDNLIIEMEEASYE